MKGLGTMAWLGIGCGAIALIGIILAVFAVGTCTHRLKKFANDAQKNPEKAAAEMMVKFNPDLELVSENDATGEMTVRNKRSGEEITMSYRDIKEGKFTVKDAEGNVMQVGGKADISKLPAWVPRYPGANAQGGMAQSSNTEGKTEGMITLTSSDAPGKIVEYFKTEGQKAGLSNAEANNMNINGQEISTLELSGDGKQLTVTATKGSGESTTTISLVYTEGQE
jgi:hypothetical protein